jgi:hypothetical protein
VNLISGSEIGSGSDILILEPDENFPSALINYFARILNASWLADFLIKELYVCAHLWGRLKELFQLTRAVNWLTFHRRSMRSAPRAMNAIQYTVHCEQSTLLCFHIKQS